MKLLNLRTLPLFIFLFFVFTPTGVEGDGISGLGVVLDMLIIALSLSVMIFSKKKIDLRVLNLVVIFIIWASFWVFFFQQGDINNIRSILVGGLISISLLLSQYERNDFKNTIFYLIVINLVVFYIQLIFMYGFKYHIDFHKIIFPWSRETYYPTYFGLVRLTGFHMEPGSLSTIMFCLNILYLKFNFNKKIIILSILSILLTISLASFIYAFLLTLILIFSSERKAFWLIIIAILTSILSVSPVGQNIYDYVGKRHERFESSQDASIEYKHNNIVFLLDASAERLLFGSGIGINDCTDCEYINSNGFLFESIFYMGIVGAFILMIIYFNISGFTFTLSSLIFVFFICIQRYGVTYNLIWAACILHYIGRGYGKEK